MSGPIKFVISGTKNSNSTKHKSSVWVEHASKLLWLLCRAASAQSTLSVANNLGPDFLVLFFFSGSCSFALKLSFLEDFALILHYLVTEVARIFELHGYSCTQKMCFSRPRIVLIFHQIACNSSTDPKVLRKLKKIKTTHILWIL